MYIRKNEYENDNQIRRQEAAINQELKILHFFKRF